MYFWFWIFHFNSFSTEQYKIHKRSRRWRRRWWQAHDSNLNSTRLDSRFTLYRVRPIRQFRLFLQRNLFDFYFLRTFFFPLCSSSSLPSSSVLRKQITKSLFILFLKYHCFDVACMKDLLSNETLSHCRWQWQFICMRWNALRNKDDMNERTNELTTQNAMHFSDGA